MGLFDRIVATGSVVLSTVGGSEAGTAAAHRYLSSPRTDWRHILQAFAARHGGRRPMQDVLDEVSQPVVEQLGRACEGSTARLRNPHPAGTLGWLAWIVARHGGWNSPNSPPGPKVMARGWERFSAMLAGAILAAESLPLRP